MKKPNVAVFFTLAIVLAGGILAGLMSAEQPQPALQFKLTVHSNDTHPRHNVVSLATRTGQPASAQATRTIPYTAEATQQPDHSWKRTSGSVAEGLTVVLTPTVADDGQLHVSYSIKVADLTALRTVGLGEAAIQVPDVVEEKTSGALSIEPGKPVQFKVLGKYDVTLVATRV